MAEGLLDGRYDSGLTSLEIAERHPELLRVEHVIGAITDAWILFGREPLPSSEIVAAPDAPVVRLLRRAAGGGEAAGAGAG